MFKDNTVFVIGAGASKEFDMPVGWELNQLIREYASGQVVTAASKQPYELFQAIQFDGTQDWNRIQADQEICRKIMVGVASAGSIDSYIDRNSDDPRFAAVAKLFIAYAIAQKEAGSKMAPDERQRIDEDKWNALDDSTWIFPFVRALFEGVSNRDALNIGQNITIISFNYDRTLEFFLLNEIQRSYHQLSRKQCYDIVARMNIIHPYGTLGPLPVEHNGNDGVPFGPRLDHVSIRQMRDSLITWSEMIDENETVDGVKLAIEQASQVVFLGFGFAPQNMRLLSVSRPSAERTPIPVISTGMGLSRAQDSNIRERIASLWGTGSMFYAQVDNVNIEYGEGCKALLNMHFRTLAV